MKFFSLHSLCMCLFIRFVDDRNGYERVPFGWLSSCLCFACKLLPFAFRPNTLLPAHFCGFPFGYYLFQIHVHKRRCTQLDFAIPKMIRCYSKYGAKREKIKTGSLKSSERKSSIEEKKNTHTYIRPKCKNESENIC